MIAGGIIKAADRIAALKYFDVAGFSPAQIRMALINKDCAAAYFATLTMNRHLRDERFNPDCRFAPAGEAFDNLDGGWPVSIQGGASGCKQFVVGAISEILRMLSDDGTIRDLYTRYLEEETTARCDRPPELLSGGTSLDVSNLAGVLLLHGVVVGLCMLGWLYPLRRQLRTRRAKQAKKARMKAAACYPPTRDTDHRSHENLDSLRAVAQHIGENEGRMIPHIDPSISELECRLRAGISLAEFGADDMARIDAKLDSPLGGRVDGLERLAEMLGQIMDAKLDAAVHQILAKVDQRIDRIPPPPPLISPGHLRMRHGTSPSVCPPTLAKDDGALPETAGAV